MPVWLYFAIAVSIIGIFLVFLSGIASKKAIGVILMFIFTVLTSASLGYGIYNARLEAKENLGKPIQEITDGEYEIFWIARSTKDNKVYFVASKIENPPRFDIRFYAIKPSDPFLKKLREYLERRQGMILKIEENEEGDLEPSLHPNPPPPLPPKTP